MIKFIAADLDGTLLNSEKELPKDFDYVLDKLNEKGIIFAASSGRQYDTVLKQFNKYSGRMAFIAENGAVAFENGKNIICDTMDGEEAAEIVSLALRTPGLYPIVCSVDGAFGDAKNAACIKDIAMYYIKYRTVENIADEIRKNKILKIAIYDTEASDTHCYKVMEKYRSTHNVLVSGDHWLDIMKPGVTKGSAIEKIQKIYGITPDECMAFGDFMNDADMMRVCRNSYAMKNAHYDLKPLCRFETNETNDDEGVTKTIRKVVFGENI